LSPDKGIGLLWHSPKKQPGLLMDKHNVPWLFDKKPFLLCSGHKLSETWRAILLGLADKAVRSVIPDLRQANTEMDIRSHVKVSGQGSNLPFGEERYLKKIFFFFFLVFSLLHGFGSGSGLEPDSIRSGNPYPDSESTVDTDPDPEGRK
jgi:hypothetical protein